MTDREGVSRLQSISHALQGAGFTLVLVIFSTLSLQIGIFQFGLSFIPVAGLLFWPEKASKTWSLGCIFLLGLLQDGLSFGPLGLYALCYLALFMTVGGGLKERFGLLSAVSAFILAAGFVAVELLVFGKLFLGYWPVWSGLVFDVIASTITFPVIYWLLTLRDALFLRSDERRIT